MIFFCILLSVASGSNKYKCGTGNSFCYDVDINPSLAASSVVIQHQDDEIQTDFAVYFKVIGKDCINPSISFEFELIDYDLVSEYLQIYGDSGLIKQCNGGSQYKCGQFTQCLTDYNLGVAAINADSQYKITVRESTNVDALCKSAHDYSINAILTLQCESIPESQSIQQSHVQTACGANKYCYDFVIYPSPDLTTRFTQIIQNVDDSVATNFYINFNPKVNDCYNPSVSFEFELIDYNSASEYLRLYGDNGALIKHCNGGSQYQCGQFTQCLTNQNLGVNQIDKDSSYKFRIYESSAVDDLCKDHPYSINAKLSIQCQSIQTKERCNDHTTDNRYCYDVEVNPSSSKVTEAIAIIQHEDDEIITDFQVYFNIINNNCYNPTISLQHEMIDYDLSSEYLQIYGDNDALIKQCNGGAQRQCGTFADCVDDHPLGITVINDGDSYKIRVRESTNVDALCTSVHDYSINAKLTLKCDGGANLNPALADYANYKYYHQPDYVVNTDNYYVNIIIGLVVILLICNIVLLSVKLCGKKNHKHKYKKVTFESDADIADSEANLVS